MKKILCLTLALAVCAFASCGNGTEPSGTLSGTVLENSADATTEDFLVYQAEDFFFDYPSDWTKGDISVANADGTKSITVTSQEKTDFYSGLDTQTYVQQIESDFELEGKTLISAGVSQSEKEGINITCITQTFSVEGTDGEFYQSIFAFDFKEKTHVLTLTQPNGLEVDTALVNAVYESIRAK